MYLRYKKGNFQHFDQSDKKWYNVGSGVGTGDFAMNQNYDINATDLVIPGCVEYVKDGLYCSFYDGYEYNIPYANLTKNSSGTYQTTSVSKYPISITPSSDNKKRPFIYGTEIIGVTLRHVTFQEGVKQIGYKAFYGQSKLDRIDFPESLEWVHQEAFRFTEWFNRQPFGPVYCGNVLYRYIPNDNYYSLTKELIIKKGTKSISSRAFSRLGYNSDGIVGFTNIVLPESLIGIGDYAFSCMNNRYNYEGEACTINIPDNVTWIGKGAFQSSRINITNLPPYLWEIQDSTFDSSIISEVMIPSATLYIGVKAFYGSKLHILSFESNSNLKSIRNQAFENCNIGSVLLPEGLQIIGDRAFANNTSLTDVYIPSTVTNISSTSFSGCNALTNVTIGKDFKGHILDISASTKYSANTLENIIDNLADNTGLDSHLLRVGSTNIAKISQEKLAEVTNKNWTIS